MTFPIYLRHLLVSVLLGLFAVHPVTALAASDDPPALQNPMSVDYLQRHLRKASPRLMLTPRLVRQLRKKVKRDPLVANMYRAFQLNAADIRQRALPERILEGRRLLDVSREMLYRVNILGIVYLVEQDEALLARIDEELQAVCRFTDWNPSHFLDVAEMSLAVSLAIDWLGEDLPASTVSLARKALLEKGLLPGLEYDGRPSWVDAENNWNQVCHAGMIAAAIACAGENPGLAARAISRALDNMPHALAAYGPDGVYPEGSTYWSYGTSFTAMTSSMLRSAFDTDFGLSDYPALKESAMFRMLSFAPSGGYYNFADCSDRRGKGGDLVLAWFAAETGDGLYLERERFMQEPEAMGELKRYAGAGLVWLTQFKAKKESRLPLAWKGGGSNPVAVFRSDDSLQYYLGAKGGRGSVNHGNMDAGSFVFELDGVRWVVDPGKQNYHELEKTGFDLWGKCQECDRWTLLTKNNFGHSTLSVNDELHEVDAYAAISDFKGGDRGSATIELTDIYGDRLTAASRRFSREDARSLLIEDRFTINEDTHTITWQLMTTADVELIPEGAILRQQGKQLRVQNLSHPELKITVVQLDPPPLALDRRIAGLKRLEIRMPAYIFSEEEQVLRVLLSGMPD